MNFSDRLIPGCAASSESDQRGDRIEQPDRHINQPSGNHRDAEGDHHQPATDLQRRAGAESNEPLARMQMPPALVARVGDIRHISGHQRQHARGEERNDPGREGGQYSDGYGVSLRMIVFLSILIDESCVRYTHSRLNAKRTPIATA